MAPPADFTRRVLARTGRQPWRARARSRWLTTFGCTGSGAALAVGLYQGLRPVGIELSSLRPPVTPADLTSGITSKASETLAGVADTVWGLGKTMAAAPPDWMASLSMSADAAAESPFVFILGASIAGLAVLSGILYATLGSSRAPA